MREEITLKYRNRITGQSCNLTRSPGAKLEYAILGKLSICDSEAPFAGGNQDC
jgi:hypothetical protein